MAMSAPEWLTVALIRINVDAVQHAAGSMTAPTWDDIGARLPEMERELQAVRDSGRGPTDVASNLRLFDSPEGTEPRVTLWRDQSAWCPYCQKVILQLEEKRVPYAVRRAPMRCYAGGELQKPAEFLALSKAGTLPVATIDGVLYPDSSSILKAVETEFPAQSLLPSTEAGRRAYKEVTILDATFANAWLVWLTTPPWVPGEAAREKAFTDSLDAIESHLEATSSGSGSTWSSGNESSGSSSTEANTGPYMLGATFSLADVKISSFMERAAAAVPFYRGLTIRTGGRWPRIERWFDAMESRPAYAALRGDFYTHCLDLPPQLSPFGLARSRDAAAVRYAAEIDGSDGKSWALPLPRGTRLEPLPVPRLQAAAGLEAEAKTLGMAFEARRDAEARRAAAGALWRNSEQISLFACRGRGLRAAVRLPLATAIPMIAAVAAAANAAAQGAPGQVFSWAALALVIYDILGTRAPLADPRAIPATALAPLVDMSLRLTAATLLDGEGGKMMVDAQRQLRALDAEAAEPLADALLYLRDRIGVPRDMDYAAARQCRAHLTWAIGQLATVRK